MSAAVVLDAAAFDIIDDSRASGVRALLRRTIDNGGEVRCAAATLAEVWRQMINFQHSPQRSSGYLRPR